MSIRHLPRRGVIAATVCVAALCLVSPAPADPTPTVVQLENVSRVYLLPNLATRGIPIESIPTITHWNLVIAAEGEGYRFLVERQPSLPATVELLAPFDPSVHYAEQAESAYVTSDALTIDSQGTDSKVTVNVSLPKVGLLNFSFFTEGHRQCSLVDSACDRIYAQDGIYGQINPEGVAEIREHYIAGSLGGEELIYWPHHSRMLYTNVSGIVAIAHV